MVHGQLSYLDSINFVVSFIAQVLYIPKYQENGSLWIVVNLANIIYWGILAVQMYLRIAVETVTKWLRPPL